MEWLHTVSRITGIDVETLRTSYVDATSAIIALSAGGGSRIAEDDREDIAQACARLFVHLVKLRPQPYRGRGNDRVVYASLRAYARKRGFTLDCGPQAIHLLEEWQA